METGLHSLRVGQRIVGSRAQAGAPRRRSGLRRRVGSTGSRPLLDGRPTTRWERVEANISAAEGYDPAVRPQDDLFGHVNGRWYETVEIPADLPMAGAFITLRLEAESQVAAILRDAAEARGRVPSGSPMQQIGDLYT